MAHIIPMRGVSYDPAAVGDAAKVVAPPYDIIDADGQAALHDRHQANIIRVELGLDHPDDGPTRNKYTRAAEALKHWLASGILRREAVPAIYPYYIDYTPPAESGAAGRRLLKGFLTTVELAEFGTGHIYPHENTRSAAKADRLELLKACRANVSPIFSLFSDPEGTALGLIDQAIAGQAPRFDFTDDTGCRQRLWAVTDQAVLDRLVALLKPKPLFIADGHHRYETALNYRRLRREQAGQASNGPAPFDTVLMLLSSLEDPGLTVLPTHRVVNSPLPPADQVETRLRGAFTIESFAFSAETESTVRQQFLATLRARGQSGHAFGLALDGEARYFVLQLKPDQPVNASSSARDRLDVSILHSHVLAKLFASKSDEETISYTKDDDDALNVVRNGKARGALLLNPTKVAEVRDVATAGERMPHKSTYFYPKPLTGLVLNVMDD